MIERDDNMDTQYYDQGSSADVTAIPQHELTLNQDFVEPSTADGIPNEVSCDSLSPVVTYNILEGASTKDRPKVFDSLG